MSIVSNMKADRIVARADNNKGDFALLTNVIGEFDLARTQKVNLDKSEDDVIIPILKTNINRAKEEVESLKSVNAPVNKIARAMQDQEVLERYLPQMLDEEELRWIAELMLAKGLKMPDMMKHLKAEYPNRYDGKLASTVAKEILG